jgi:hypothetical protein
MTPGMMKAAASSGVAAAAEEKEVDVAGMFAAKAQESTPVDDGSGKLEVWRVEDFKKVNDEL